VADSSDCKHERFNATVAVFKSPDKSKTGVRLRVCCETCGTQFGFDPSETTVTGADLLAVLMPKVP